MFQVFILLAILVFALGCGCWFIWQMVGGDGNENKNL